MAARKPTPGARRVRVPGGPPKDCHDWQTRLIPEADKYSEFSSGGAVKAASQYSQDVRAQPEALRKTVKYYRSTEGRGLLRGAAEALSRGPSHLLLSGMGASLFACLAARHGLEGSRFSHRVEDSSYLAEHGRATLETAGGLVLVSQSGKTIEAVRLLSERRPEIPTVLLSCSKSGDLARMSEVVLPIVAMPDGSVSLKTYTASVLVLSFLFTELSGQGLDEQFANAEAAIDAMDSYLNSWDQVHPDALRLASTATSIYVLGRGPSLGSAYEASLLLKETAKLPCEGMGSAQFRHGAIEVVESGVLCIIFAGGDEMSRGFHRRLVAEVNSYGGSTLVVGSHVQLAEISGPGMLCPVAVPSMMALLEVVPIQLLAGALARDRGDGVKNDTSCWISGEEP
jgi:glutamine---fructose-6-phosphate transaminase (isomerizing)